jgi:hypothetical protein
MGQQTVYFLSRHLSDAFATVLSRLPIRRACRVAMIALHSAQRMSAASCSFLSLALSTSKISGWTLLQVGHHTRGKWSSLSIAFDRIARRGSPDRPRSRTQMQQHACSLLLKVRGRPRSNCLSRQSSVRKRIQPRLLVDLVWDED